MSESNQTIPLVEACLGRFAKGDPAAWDDLMTHAFHQLLDQCSRIVKQQLSRPNPLITENAVLAELYLRLRKAMENEKVHPTTAREFFGLAARNIRWQIQDMVRKPSAEPGREDILTGLADSQGVTAEVIDREKWSRFWEAIETLQPEEREVFDLIWINGLSQYEAAAAIGKTRNQVDSVWRRIKMKIVKCCQDFVTLEC